MAFTVEYRLFDDYPIAQMPDGYLSAFFIALSCGQDVKNIKYDFIEFEAMLWRKRREKVDKDKRVYKIPRRAWFYFDDEDVWLCPCVAEELALEFGNTKLSEAIGSGVSTLFDTSSKK